MYGQGSQPILVLSKFDLILSKKKIILVNEKRSKHKNRSGKKSSIGKYSSSKGI